MADEERCGLEVGGVGSADVVEGVYQAVGEFCDVDGVGSGEGPFLGEEG